MSVANRWLSVVILFAIALFLSLLAAMANGWARNLDGQYDNSPNHEWFESQHNSLGQWCCNDADGHEYDGDYTINADGSVTAEWEGKPQVIESFKVLHGPNPTGHAVWWYLLGINSEPSTFCFIPGAQG